MSQLMKWTSQQLRKNATKEENRLWYNYLRAYPVQFRRQVVFGRFIVDFYCAKAKLVLELDGSQHYEGNGPEYDAERTNCLVRGYGLRILRFTNKEVRQNFEGVCTAIDLEVKGLTHAPSSAPCGGTFPPEGGRLCACLERNPIMKTVTLYTDGACSGNPGPGGWGAILMFGEHKRELSGGEAKTTNNRMELTAVIKGLEALKQPCVVELYSDSKYVIDALEKGWAKGWRARGWVKSDKKPALNPDLWERLLELCETHTVNLHWVKGHAENPYNNRCDELAVGEWQKLKA